MMDEKQYYASQTVEIEDEKVRNTELLTQGAGVAAGYGGYKALSYFSDTRIGQQFLQKRNYDYINKSFLNSNSMNGNIVAQRGGQLRTRDFAMEALRTVEEGSPGKIVRTFQLSHLLSPIATRGMQYEFSGEQVMAQSNYLGGLIKAQGDSNFTLDPLKHGKFGLRVQDGQLFEIEADGVSGRKLLDNAMLTSTSFSLDRKNAAPLEYRNPLVRGYAGAAGFYTQQMETQLNQMTANRDMSNITVIGGKNAGMDWMKAYAKTTFMRGVDALASPLDEVLGSVPSEKVQAFGRNTSRILFGNVGRGVSEQQNLISPIDIKTLRNNIDNFSFNAGDNVLKAGAALLAGTSRSTMFGTLGKNIAKAAAVRYMGFQILDHLSTEFAPDDQAFSLGITEGLATAAVQMHLAYARTVGDPMQDYRNEQERLFEGSTQLMTLSGLAIAPAMGSAITSYGQKLYETARYGKEFAEEQTARRRALFGTTQTSRIAQKMGINPGVMFQETTDGLSSTERTFRRLMSGRRLQINSMRSAIPGLLVALPFLPGALAGEQSEELRKEYSGEKEVAIRANRWWGSGSNSFEGDHIKYFKKGAYAEMMSGAKTAQLYGDKETERDLNPFLNPLDYIRDPYKFEKMHEKDRPYAVWGMDVSFGSFFGKLFENTVGAIIKPDIINKDLEKHLKPGQTLDDAIESGSFAFEETGLTVAEKSLIDDGLMLSARAAQYDTAKTSAEWQVNAAEDLVGLSGWVTGLVRQVFGLRVEEGDQLSRSGQATNVANDIADMQLGGAFGTTETLRRFVPTNAWSREKGANPLKNEMPQWLPGENSGYFMDFSTGDPFSKIEKGFARLPGAGYAKIHKDLEGLDPEDYPEIFKYKILQDVAIGSQEFRAQRSKIEAREKAGQLTEFEAGMLAEIREQQLERRDRKRFTEYLDDSAYEGTGVVTEGLQKGWQLITHKMESPLEDLTFFRPGGKLIHKRTAVEDYLKTQVHGSDTAMWTEYYDQFIKPAVNRGLAFFNKTFVPDEIHERRAVDEYFDRLNYIKYKKLEDKARAEFNDEDAKTYSKMAAHTRTGQIASGYDDMQDVQAAYASLQRSDKDYFGSFLNLTNQEDKEILMATLPDQMQSMYSALWERREAIVEQLENGGTMEQAMQESAQSELQELIDNNQDAYRSYQSERRDYSFREYLARTQSESYINDTTGMPDDNFIGWDPRIDMNQVKLRTLTVGEEQIHEYGFWESDVEKLKRMIGILKDQTVTQQIDKIKNNAINRKLQEDEVAQQLTDQGYEVKSVEIRDSKAGDFTINVTKEE